MRTRVETDLKDLVMLASDPKPGYHCTGVLVISFWARHGNDEPATCDFLSTPPKETGAQIRAVAAMTAEMVKEMDGL